MTDPLDLTLPRQPRRRLRTPSGASAVLPPATENNMSFKAEVQTAGDGDNWSSSAVRLPTHEQALAYGTDLKWRWTAVNALRVVESDDPVNYRWVDGSLKAGA